MIWSVSKLSAFPPLSCLLPGSSLAPSVLEVGWQWVQLKRSYVRDKKYLSAVLCLVKSIEPFLLLLFRISISRGLSWSLESFTRHTDASTHCLTVSITLNDNRISFIVDNGFRFSILRCLLFIVSSFLHNSIEESECAFTESRNGRRSSYRDR